jgi:hypothetical protein
MFFSKPVLKRGILILAMWFCFGPISLLASPPLPPGSDIYTGDLTLNTQSEVNAFHYKEVTGDLVISDLAVEVITDLSPLSGLETVGGDFIIEYTGLEDLTGLSSLQEVDGYVEIWENTDLKSLEGLSSLSTVIGLEIAYNPGLQDLGHFSSLTHIDYELVIIGNPQLFDLTGLSALQRVPVLVFIENNNLQTLDGLSALTRIDEVLFIFFNRSLVDLDGLSGLKSCGFLEIMLNPMLENVDGLSGLTTAGGIDLYFLPSLKHIDGLSGLKTIKAMPFFRPFAPLNSVSSRVASPESSTSHSGSLLLGAFTEHSGLLKRLKRNGLISGNTIQRSRDQNRSHSLANGGPASFLAIEGNDDLTNLDGLSGLESVEGPVIVASNPSLINCCGLMGLYYHGYGDYIQLIDNGCESCNSVEALLTGNCVHTLSGTVWADVNQNGEMDVSECGIEDVILRIQNNETGTYKAKTRTGSDGSYFFKNVYPGQYSVMIDRELSSLPDGTTLTTDGWTRTISVPDLNALTTFGLYHDSTLLCDPSGNQGQEEIEPNQLVFVEGSPTYHKGDDVRDWSNLVDGETEGWSATTLARGEDTPHDPAWGIFRFADGGLYQFNYLTFLTDNGAADDGARYDYQTLTFKVSGSTTGLDPEDFEEIAYVHRQFDGQETEWHRLNEYVTARYVKVTLIRPHRRGGWRQMVEFDVQTENKKGAIPASLPEQESTASTQTITLAPVQPNPFNPTATIRYELKKATRIQLQVYDVRGRRVTTLVDTHQPEGLYSVQWNATSEPSGIYFIRLTASGQSQVKTMTLAK